MSLHIYLALSRLNGRSTCPDRLNPAGTSGVASSDCMTVEYCNACARKAAKMVWAWEPYAWSGHVWARGKAFTGCNTATGICRCLGTIDLPSGVSSLSSLFALRRAGRLYFKG